MTVTADQVVVELQAKVDGYMRDTARAQADFSQKVGKMAADAASAGDASAVAFDRASGAFTKAGKGADLAGKGLKSVGAEGRMAQQQMRNLAFQFQDIGTMLAAGQSPFMLLAQQLPQVTMYGGSLNGVMGALKGTLAGLLSPLGLATTAFVLLGSTAISWVSDTSGEIETLDEVLKRHKALIDEIRDAYGEAAIAASEYAKNAADELGVRLAASVEENKVRLTAALRDLFDGGELGYFTRNIDNPFLPTKQFEEFRGAVTQLYASFQSGEPDLVAFRDRVVEIGQETGNAGAATQILDLVGNIFELDDAIRVGEEGVGALAVALTELDASISKVTSEKAQKEVSDLAQRAIDGEISIDDFKKAVAALSTSAPDLSGHIAEFVRLIGVIRQAKAEVEGFAGRESQGGRVRYGGSGFMQLPDTAPTPDRRVDPYFDDPYTKTRGGGRKRENEYERLNKQIEARTKALQAETAAQTGLNPLVDDYGFAAEKARLQAQLLTAAEQAKIAITPDIAAAIDATAEGYARAAAEARKLAEDQREALRSAEEWLGVGRNVTRGFIDDLINGKSAAESFANAISKIGDALLNDVLENIFKINQAGSGGILSSILGLFGGGFMDGRGGGFAGLIGYSQGTANTGGMRGQPRGVVHGQEAVIPLPAGGKVPVQIQAPSMARTSGHDRGSRNITIDINVSGARGNSEIMEMVSEGVRHGLTAYDREAGPAMVNRVVNDPRAIG